MKIYNPEPQIERNAAILDEILKKPEVIEILALIEKIKDKKLEMTERIKALKILFINHYCQEDSNQITWVQRCPDWSENKSQHPAMILLANKDYKILHSVEDYPVISCEPPNQKSLISISVKYGNEEIKYSHEIANLQCTDTLCYKCEKLMGLE